METTLFEKFVRNDINGVPTFDLELAANLMGAHTLRIQKVDEDEEAGYCYSVSLGLSLKPRAGELWIPIGTGWFDGFGKNGENDVLRFVYAYLMAFV